ncbi:MULTISPECIES: geranylgeranylglycerol-phosphate geranylgeranyltransferase [Capnocytophaga]|uniref:Prenyltransferase n=1 Tax=Capnocytophaga ochracea TaxID=1018 RepID=A0A2X2R958_CAPOC|nr:MULTISPECIES: geranylgeranylglycerol-phosphate geranylgeranyltransferase [Capnocytophaga]AVM56107.1 ubiquinone biosynthesis protein UbiA [Capnocytophaga sp. oral taxon 864]SQA77588.1 prenyltransferase [Capnocytophaga ochracea]
MRRTTLLKLIGIFSVVRGYNIMIVCLAQYLAAIFVLSHKPWREVIFDDSLLMLVIAGALAIAGGYIINGFYDKEKDLINKPTKTMIDHLVSQNTKLTLYFLLNFLSVIVASYVSFRAVIFFSGYIFTMWLYSHRIKKLLFFGNLTSAVLAIIPFFAIFVYYRNFEAIIFVHALLIFLLILIKEFIKDLQNIKGDLAHNYATIPVVYGESFSKKLITLSVVLCTLPIYVLLNYFSIGNLTYFLWFMLIYLCIFVCLLWRSKDQKHYVLLHNMLKLILVAGIFSVALTVK